MIFKGTKYEQIYVWEIYLSILLIFFSSIRKKITGENRGPELAKVIYLLGKEELIKRLVN